MLIHMRHTPWPPSAEYCSRGSLFQLLQGAARDPTQAAQLTWRRRLSMVGPGKVAELRMGLWGPCCAQMELVATWLQHCSKCHRSRLCRVMDSCAARPLPQALDAALGML